MGLFRLRPIKIDPSRKKAGSVTVEKRATVIRGRRKTGSRRKMEVKQERRDSTLGLFSVVYTAELVQ